MGVQVLEQGSVKASTMMNLAKCKRWNMEKLRGRRAGFVELCRILFADSFETTSESKRRLEKDDRGTD